MPCSGKVRKTESRLMAKVEFLTWKHKTKFNLQRAAAEKYCLMQSDIGNRVASFTTSRLQR